MVDPINTNSNITVHQTMAMYTHVCTTCVEVKTTWTAWEKAVSDSNYKVIINNNYTFVSWFLDLNILFQVGKYVTLCCKCYKIESFSYEWERLYRHRTAPCRIERVWLDEMHMHAFWLVEKGSHLSVTAP